HQVGIADDELRDRCLSSAKDRYMDSLHLRSTLWSRFGLLEADRRLTGAADEEAYREVEQEARRRLTNRREPRSMALLSETRLIAVTSRPNSSLAEIEAAYEDASRRLGEVDDSMTLYSQRRKHNVNWGDFATELDELYEEARSART